MSAQVVSLHTVKPLDDALLADAFARFAVVATIEEHSVLGGLGSSIAEWVVDQPPQKARLVRIGTADDFIHETGNQEYARRYYGLTAEKVVERTLHALDGRGTEATAKRPVDVSS